MSRLRQDLHTLAGAYALNALPEDELRRFEEHLAHCESCVQEVRGLSETAALLGAATARTPPEAMRRRVLEEVSRTRQLAPAQARLAVPRPRWWSWGGSLVLAASLVVVLALGGVVAWQQRQIAELENSEQAIAAVLAAPDIEVASGRPAEGVSATVVSSESRGDLVFSAQGLDPLSEQDYQLWLAEPDGSVRSAGLLRVAPGGEVRPLLADGIGEAEGIAVTIEPEGGSDQPTSDPMMQMPLES